MTILRDSTVGDEPAILRLNEESVKFLSPLDGASWRRLAHQAAYLRIAQADGGVAAFLLALAPGQDYASENYRWFCEHSAGFLYIDRIVVAGGHRGRGLGAALYADLFAFARSRGVARVVCEFDVEPPNPASASFHARFGFREVGSQWVRGGAKRVSLQEALVG